MIRVITGRRQRIQEDARSLCEGDAVFPQVSSGLSRIPRETHSTTLQYTRGQRITQVRISYHHLPRAFPDQGERALHIQRCKLTVPQTEESQPPFEVGDDDAEVIGGSVLTCPNAMIVIQI